MIQLRRIYDDPLPHEGHRILVDRLWPRGFSKEKAPWDVWMKEISPSHELRKWFNHQPEKWEEFQVRFNAELENNPATVKAFQDLLDRHEVVTLLFAARDTTMNNAVAIRNYFAGQA